MIILNNESKGFFPFPLPPQTIVVSHELSITMTSTVKIVEKHFFCSYLQDSTKKLYKLSTTM